MINNSKISNPIYAEILNYGLIKKKNLKIISKQTRDAKMLIFQDKISNIIFLQKYLRKIDYYKSLKDANKSKKDSSKKNSYTKTLKGTIESTRLDDTNRRLLQFNHLMKNKDVLDFGTGWGFFLSKLKNARSVNAVEIRKNCISFIKKNFKKIEIKKNLNSFTQKFDVITMFHVLEHIPFQVNTLRILKNKLKKNGKIIIEVPHAKDFLLGIDPLDEFKNFTLWSEHLILHTEKSLEKVLKYSGFKKIKIIYFQRYGLANHMGWIIKRKPGGHEYFKHAFSTRDNDEYIQKLISNRKTDTLIAIASN